MNYVPKKIIIAVLTREDYSIFFALQKVLCCKLTFSSIYQFATFFSKSKYHFPKTAASGTGSRIASSC